MFRVLIIVLACSFSQQIFAKSLNLVINGKAVHERKNNLNEENWGIGFEYNLNSDKNWINFVNGGYFKDSNFNLSKYLGGGTKRRFFITDKKDSWYFDIGVTAFLMTRKDYRNNHPFVGLLPYLSVGTSQFAINGTYIPSVSPKYEALLFFQAVVTVYEW
jgi:hypothetical protein